jgi:hypothetical protein
MTMKKSGFSTQVSACSTDLKAMKSFSFARWACAFLLLLSPCVHAEWGELTKDEEVFYGWDKESVQVVHVSRLVWGITNLTTPTKFGSGEDFQSILTRYRINCRNDTFLKLSESIYALPNGKGKEIFAVDKPDWRPNDTAIRPGTHIALLKKQIWAPTQTASSE